MNGIDFGLVGLWLIVWVVLSALGVLIARLSNRRERWMVALVVALLGAMSVIEPAASLTTQKTDGAGTPIGTSARKGAVSANVPATMSAIGASHGYNYVPYSNNQSVTPMLKRKHIQMLRGDINEDCGAGYDQCPSRGIADTIAGRGAGGYWLIFNEPGGEDGYQNEGGVTQAAHDACYAIRYIKQRDPTAKFIVGYYRNFAGEWGWPYVAAQYGLDTDINNVIAGWHIHTYDGSLSLGNLDMQLEEFRNNVLQFKSAVIDVFTPGKELWLTEFGTLMRRNEGETLWCDDLARQTDCECRFDRIDSDPNQTCVRYMQKLVGWLESSESPVNRYYWWSYGPPMPEHITEHSWQRDICYGSLTNASGNLNNLGKALAAIGSMQATPTPPPVVSATPSPARTPTPVASATPSPTRTPASVASATPLPTRTELPGEIECYARGGTCCAGTYDCCPPWARIGSSWGTDSLGCNPERRWPGGAWCCLACAPVPACQVGGIAPTQTPAIQPTAASTSTPTATPIATVIGPSCKPCTSGGDCASSDEVCAYCYQPLGYVCVRWWTPNGDCTICRNRLTSETSGLAKTNWPLLQLIALLLAIALAALGIAALVRRAWRREM
jgi:hypothetical protein